MRPGHLFKSQITQCDTYILFRPCRLLKERVFSDIHLARCREKDLEIYYIESDKGHDTFTVSRRATRVYYVIDGSGYFTISDHRHDVSRGVLVEIASKSRIFLFRKNETYSRFQATLF